MAAKKRLTIAPKLKEDKKIKDLPVQSISVEDIEKMAIGQKQEEKNKLKPTPKKAKEKKRPQGRPRREIEIKRISSHLPVELYDKVQNEIRANGYTLNGFLAKVVREYFEKK